MTTAPCRATVPELARSLDSTMRELVRRASCGNDLAVSVLDAAAAAARQRAETATLMVQRLRSEDVPLDHSRATDRWREEEDLVLNALRALGVPSTARQVAPYAGLDVDRVRNALTRLRARRRVHHAGHGHWQEAIG
jgi:hypothetical protein